MPDISMCQNETCAWRFRCYRFMAEPSYIQTYADFTVPPRRARCDWWIPLSRKARKPVLKDDGPTMGWREEKE